MILIDNLKINVEENGEGKISVLLLHGWGQSTKSYFEVASFLAKYCKVYNVDLPGFGISDKPTYAFDTSDYARIIKKIISYYEINQPIIIGHSFGGKVAIKYTSLYNNVSKLVLIDSAGIVHKKPLIYYIKIAVFKFLKKVLNKSFLKSYQSKILSKFGSTDYKNADELMKKILVRVVNEDIREDLDKIKCPTLLVWGVKDNVTPLSDAYIMKEHLIDCGIVKIENAGHYSYLEDLNLFLRVLDSFILDN